MPVSREQLERDEAAAKGEAPDPEAQSEDAAIDAVEDDAPEKPS